MSLNDFAPYIQFLAAFYLSLGFEDLVLRFFFTPFFKKELNSLYEKVARQFSLGESENAAFKSKLDRKKDGILTKSRYISTIMFVLCLVLLLVAALEISIPASTFSWEKNSWLGYWWSIVIALITIPSLWIVCDGLYYRFCNIRKIKAEVESLNQEIQHNISLCLEGHMDQCNNFFKNEILKKISKEHTWNPSMLIDVKNAYSKKCFDDILSKI